MISMYRIEFHLWNSNSGYYCSSTFENLEEYCSAEEYFKACESDMYGSLIPEDPDEAINIEIYDEDNNLLSEYWVQKEV